MSEPTQEPVLCYVEKCWAFFTRAPLSAQWGDDWDDAPYEHNAGWPYEEYTSNGTRLDSRIVKIAFDSDLQTPADRGGGISRFSVEMINAKIRRIQDSKPNEKKKYT
jgi:hypothetical protein